MESTEIIKKESFNRTKQEIDELIKQWTESGKNKKVFCLEQGLKYNTFIGWTKDRKKELLMTKGLSSGFIPLQVQQDNKSVFAEVKFSNGNCVLLYEYVGTGYLRSLLGRC